MIKDYYYDKNGFRIRTNPSSTKNNIIALSVILFLMLLFFLPVMYIYYPVIKTKTGIFVFTFSFLMLGGMITGLGFVVNKYIEENND